MNEIGQEQVLAAYHRAPLLVRDVFNAESTTQVVIDLQKPYGLHIDTVGVVGKELGYMLLGLVNPSEFVSHLRAAGISQDVVHAIVGEINQKVFKPLQAEMRKPQPIGGEEGPNEERPDDQLLPRAPVPPPPPRPAPAPPPAPRYAPPPPPPRPVPPPAPLPKSNQYDISYQSPPAPLNNPPGGLSGEHPAAPDVVAPPPPAPTRAPLPPRTVMPGASAPRFVKPMPPRPAGLGTSSPGARSPTFPPLPQPPQRGAPPPNLPTVEDTFNLLPPLAKPVPPPISSVPDGTTPHTRYPSDPYREPTE